MVIVLEIKYCTIAIELRISNLIPGLGDVLASMMDLIKETEPDYYCNLTTRSKEAALFLPLSGVVRISRTDKIFFL
jgi:hypothetical protein